MSYSVFETTCTNAFGVFHTCRLDCYIHLFFNMTGSWKVETVASKETFFFWPLLSRNVKQLAKCVVREVKCWITFGLLVHTKHRVLHWHSIMDIFLPFMGCSTSSFAVGGSISWYRTKMSTCAFVQRSGRLFCEAFFSAWKLLGKCCMQLNVAHQPKTWLFSVCCSFVCPCFLLDILLCQCHYLLHSGNKTSDLLVLLVLLFSMPARLRSVPLILANHSFLVYSS